MARLSLSFFSINRPLSLSSGEGGAMRSSETEPSSGTLRQTSTKDDLTATSARFITGYHPQLLFTDISLSWRPCAYRQHESAVQVRARFNTNICRCVSESVCVHLKLIKLTKLITAVL